MRKGVTRRLYVARCERYAIPPTFTAKADQWVVELDAAPADPKARAPLADLDRRQAAVLAAAAPGVKPDVEYRTALAGFAATSRRRRCAPRPACAV